MVGRTPRCTRTSGSSHDREVRRPVPYRCDLYIRSLPGPTNSGGSRPGNKSSVVTYVCPAALECGIAGGAARGGHLARIKETGTESRHASAWRRILFAVLRPVFA